MLAQDTQKASGISLITRVFPLEKWPANVSYNPLISGRTSWSKEVTSPRVTAPVASPSMASCPLGKLCANIGGFLRIRKKMDDLDWSRGYPGTPQFLEASISGSQSYLRPNLWWWSYVQSILGGAVGWKQQPAKSNDQYISQPLKKPSTSALAHVAH